MDVLEFHSRVGNDGVLSLNVSLGAAEAGADVVVTIEPAKRSDSNGREQDWKGFIARTYGSCAEFDLEEPPDLSLQDRCISE